MGCPPWSLKNINLNWKFYFSEYMCLLPMRISHQRPKVLMNVNWAKYSFRSTKGANCYQLKNLNISSKLNLKKQPRMSIP